MACPPPPHPLRPARCRCRVRVGIGLDCGWREEKEPLAERRLSWGAMLG
ncbi:hypothetical protein [uncultured Victivallis sp.]|nr:hypothetical protein [uncultured Victivallis sp.]